MQIILVRHGLSEANISRFYSLDDTILHESGFSVLNNTRRNLEKYEIDEVYASKLKRSQETAQRLGFSDFKIDGRLNELDFGEFKGKYFDHIRANEKDFFEKQKNDLFNFPYPGGESINDLIKRTSEFLEEKSKENKNILCVSHGIAIKASLFWLLEDMENWKRFWIDNGSITVFNISDGKKMIESINLLWNSST